MYVIKLDNSSCTRFMCSHTHKARQIATTFLSLYKSKNLLFVQNYTQLCGYVLYSYSQRLQNSPAISQLLFPLFVYMGEIPSAVFSSLLFLSIPRFPLREICAVSFLRWKALPPLFATLLPLLPLQNTFHLPTIENSTFYTLRFCKFNSYLLPVYSHSTVFLAFKNYDS